MTPKHPAKYHPSILQALAPLLPHAARVLDPMAGVGAIFNLWHLRPDLEIEAIELEPEWAHIHELTKQGDVHALPYRDGSFDAIVVSPPYGNRMADKLLPTDRNGRHHRNTYATHLGRNVSANSASSLKFGAEYYDFFCKAWAECIRVLKPDGLFFINTKNFIRDGKEIHVTTAHGAIMDSHGWVPITTIQIPCPGLRHGENREARVPHEDVVVYIASG